MSVKSACLTYNFNYLYISFAFNEDFAFFVIFRLRCFSLGGTSPPSECQRKYLHRSGIV